MRFPSRNHRIASTRTGPHPCTRPQWSTGCRPTGRRSTTGPTGRRPTTGRRSTTRRTGHGTQRGKPHQHLPGLPIAAVPADGGAAQVEPGAVVQLLYVQQTGHAEGQLAGPESIVLFRQPEHLADTDGRLTSHHWPLLNLNSAALASASRLETCPERSPRCGSGASVPWFWERFPAEGRIARTARRTSPTRSPVLPLRHLSSSSLCPASRRTGNGPPGKPAPTTRPGSVSALAPAAAAGGAHRPADPIPPHRPRHQAAAPVRHDGPATRIGSPSRERGLPWSAPNPGGYRRLPRQPDPPHSPTATTARRGRRAEPAFRAPPHVAYPREFPFQLHSSGGHRGPAVRSRPQTTRSGVRTRSPRRIDGTRPGNGFGTPRPRIGRPESLVPNGVSGPYGPLTPRTSAAGEPQGERKVVHWPMPMPSTMWEVRFVVQGCAGNARRTGGRWT